MNILDNLKYTRDHEWIKVEGNSAWIGISDYAQSQMGDIVYVEVETEGEILNKGESLGSIEAVKTVEDIYMPVSGEIVEFNEKLIEKPDLLNKDPYGEGWIVKITLINPSELDDLLDSQSYKEFIESL
ncbi:MAG TPA: glycine cleavage system protein GcvH [Bacteroidales bacterium]|jgi:glycine cleavage system H protein|nr:glycine cleavage system protein GcvH [Bacteroidales bacterium]MDI9574307.1 glycine cleavage system protein GcvH [Bacteroidota bacterium]OQC59787.1 MAG: Glycine cleavage system H protein [Bacteroidetes bacterium ADurb.Bin012]MBP9511930.1 glycine cleavage system protein GcvH [Bacteroidales bacterium]MBP9588428.1 glycine cleavage system protein GcvH [Bacteroidales bacterium]